MGFEITEPPPLSILTQRCQRRSLTDYVSRFRQVMKYVPSSIVKDMLTKMEKLALTNHSHGENDFVSDDTDDTESGFHSSPSVSVSISPRVHAGSRVLPVERHLFSPPDRRVTRRMTKTKHVHGDPYRARKKPRRRKRKDNGGYDWSPAVSSVDITSEDEDSNDFNLNL